MNRTIKKRQVLSALTGASAPRPSVGSVPIWIGEWQEIKVNLILERRKVTFNMLDPSNFHWFTKTSIELQSRIWMVTWPPYALVAGSTYVKTDSGNNRYVIIAFSFMTALWIFSHCLFYHSQKLHKSRLPRNVQLWLPFPIKQSHNEMLNFGTLRSFTWMFFM